MSSGVIEAVNDHPHDFAGVQSCPSYAKMPNGEPITAEFLTKVLPGGGSREVTSFRVDEESLLVGRHSMTFRLVLEWSLPRLRTVVMLGDDPAAAAAAAAAAPAVEDGSTVVPPPCGCTPVDSVFVKRMACKELAPRSLIKWRTSIASYRAEATFFEDVAGTLGSIVPHVFWVHVDDRLGDGETGWVDAAAPTAEGNGVDGHPQGGQEVENKKKKEEEEVEALRESCFMMITEDLGAEGAATSCGAKGCARSHVGSQCQGAADEIQKAGSGGWEQFVALDFERAKAVFSALAHLHATFWPDLSATAAAVAAGPPPAAAVKGAHQDPVFGDSVTNGAEGGRGRGRYARGLHVQGTFWSLEKRNPEDLEGLEQEYEKLLRNFRGVLPAAWFEPPRKPGGRQGGAEVGGAGNPLSAGEDVAGRRGEACLGRRLAARALELDVAVHANGDACLSASGRGGGGGGRRGRTLVHGDLKTWNVFFRKGGGWWGTGPTAGAARHGAAVAAAPAEGRVKFIDWQWCGEALAAADVAYVMCTSLEPAVLSRERELLDHYHAELSRGLEARFGVPPLPSLSVGKRGGASSGSSHGTAWYPAEQFEDDFRVAFLDYMRCVVGTLWKGLTPEKMEVNRRSGPGLSLINRSSQHMQWMIQRATRLLDELDGVSGVDE